MSNAGKGLKSMEKTLVKKLDIRNAAQDELLHGMRCAMCTANDKGISEQVVIEMEKQYRRIAKIFGYDPNDLHMGV
jgi:hypothetical protein